MKAVLRSGETRHVLTATTTVGRQGCHVTLTSPAVDGQHAVFEIREQAQSGTVTALLRDLNSSQGTYVNGARVQNASVRLAHGDRISFGHAIDGEVYNFELEQDQSAGMHSGYTSPLLPDLTSTCRTPSRMSFTPSHVVSPTTTTLPTALSGIPGRRHSPLSRNHGASTAATLSMRSSDANLLSAASLPAMSNREKDEKLLRMGDEISRLAAFESECHRKDIVIADLRQHVGGRVQAADESNRAVEQLTARLKILEAGRESDKQKISSMTDQVQSLRKELAQRRQTITSMTDERKRLQQTIVNLEGSVSQLQKELADKSASTAFLRSELTLARAHRSTGQKEVEDLRQCVTVQEALAQERGQTTVKLTKQLEDARKEAYGAAQMKADIERMREELAGKRSRLHDKERECNSLKSKVTAFTDDVTELLADCIDDDGEEEEDEEDEDDEDTPMSKHQVVDLDSALHQFKDLLDENKHLKSEVESLKDDYEQVTNAETSTSNILQDFGKCCNISAADKRPEAVQEQVQKLDEITVPEKCAGLKKNLTSLLRLVAMERAEMVEVGQLLSVEGDMMGMRQSKGLVDAAKRLQQKVDDLNESISSLQTQLQHARKEHEHSLASLTAALRREADNDKAVAVGEYQTQSEEARQSAVAEAVAAQKELEIELRATIASLEESLAHARSECQGKDGEVEKSREEAERLQEEKNTLQRQVETEAARMADARAAVQQACQEEIDTQEELCRQHALTIVSLEERLSAVTEEVEQQSIRSAEPVASSTAALKPKSLYSAGGAKEDDASLTPLTMHTVPDVSTFNSSLVGPRIFSTPISKTGPFVNSPVTTNGDLPRVDQQHLLLEIQGLQRLLQVARQDATTLKAQLAEQTSVMFSLRRDLAGSSAQVQDLRAKRSKESAEKEHRLRQELAEKHELTQRQLGEISMLKDLSEQYRSDMEAQLAESQYLHQLLEASHGVESEQREELKHARQKWKSGLRTHREQLASIEEKHQKTFSLAEVGARCQAQGHDKIIRDQSEALKTLRSGRPGETRSVVQQQEVQSLQLQLEEARSQLGRQSSLLLSPTSQANSIMTLSNGENVITKNQLDAERESQRDLLEALEDSEKSYCSLVRRLTKAVGLEPLQGTRSILGLMRKQRTPVMQDRGTIEETLSSRISAIREKVKRKEDLLKSYEDDLRKLRTTELENTSLAAKVSSMEMAARNTSQEVAMLRESVRRQQDELDQQMRLNVSLRSRQLYKESQGRQVNPPSHSCLLLPSEVDQKLSAQKDSYRHRLRRRDLEVQTLKNELALTDGQLQAAMSNLSRSGT